ncbi:MAG: SAM-dependent chlorinase/fluorinase [Bacteroidota bacterium]
MAIITLTTDYGLKDHFVGILKGAIYKELPDATVVDISHSIGPFNIQECAYILENSYYRFPPGSIHIVGVDAEATQENQHIAVFIDGHYFITANNGVIGLITSERKPDRVVEIQLPNTVTGELPTMDVFVQVACHIARGGTLEVVGKPFAKLRELRDFSPTLSDDGNTIVGRVIYIDNYGNVVTNIHVKFFLAQRKGRSFEIQARTTTLQEIHAKYSDIVNFDLDRGQRKGPGDLLALINSSGYLELAVYKSNPTTVGGASTLLGLDYRDRISITFA